MAGKIRLGKVRSLKLKVENTICWRQSFDVEGKLLRESNAKFIRWLLFIELKRVFIQGYGRLGNVRLFKHKVKEPFRWRQSFDAEGK